jgi:tetratricopeptide (TPR) repeat protein
MRCTGNDGRLGLGLLVVLLGGLEAGVREPPGGPTGKLDSRQQEQLGQLAGQVTKATQEGDFGQAAEAARAIATLRKRWQGERHWESVDARDEVPRWEALARLPEKEGRELGKVFRLAAQAEALDKQNKYRDAEGLYRQALAVCVRVLGEGHRETAECLEQVATSTLEQGKYAEAQPLFEQALAIRRQVLGEEHRLTAVACNDLAFNLKKLGRYAEAKPLYEQALTIWRKALGEEHPDTAHGYNNLAGNLDDQGKYVEAQPLYEKALAIRRKALGEEHPLTTDSYNNVASNLHDQGKYGEAQPLLEKALAIKRKVLGEQHPDTARGYNNLAAILKAQGQSAEAQPLYEQSLAIRLKVLGEEHPDTAAGYNNLAANLDDQGKSAEAQPLHEKALAIRCKVFGEEHPDTAISYNNVAFSLNKQGKYAAAQLRYEQSLAIRRKVLGEEHPATATGYDNLASNLDDQGQYAAAQPLYEKALAIRRKVLGNEHPDIAHSCSNAALNLKAQGKYAEAQLLFEKALTIWLKVLGEEHPATATGYDNLAANLDDQGKHAEAQPLHEKALAIRRKVLGEEHPDTARSYSNVAFNLKAQGKYAEAQPLFEKALASHRKVLGNEHPSTAITCNKLVADLWRLDKIGAAVRLLQESLPGQEVARFHSAPSGFDRAVATSRGLSPQVLLALGLVRLHQPAAAFRHAEAGLARGLLDDLAELTPEAGRIAALRDRLDSLDRQWLSLFGHDILSADQQALRERLADQRRQTIAQLARLAAEFSAGQLLPLADVQKQLPADAALVLWLDVDRLGEHQACIVRPKGDPAWVRLPGSGKDEEWTDLDLELTDRLYRLLRQPTPDDAEQQELTAALRRQRLEPLRPHLGAADGLPAVRHLLVVPIGWAGRMPLAVLTEEYRISYVPSGSVYARLRQQHRAVQGTPLLALGDPAFAAPVVHQPEPPPRGVLLSFVQPGGNAGRAGLRGGDVLLEMGGSPLGTADDLRKALAQGGTLRYWREGKEQSTSVPAGRLGVRLDDRSALQAVAAWRQAESSPVLRGPDPLPLPGTRWEVQALSRLVPKATALLGSDASEQRLDELAGDGKLKEFRLLHLATHGVVDEQTPARSRLLLARDHLPDPRDTPVGRRPYTGELTVAAIRESWKLDADLVTLSACKTALGREGQGEGLLGFAQAFLQCGARSVVLSRWAADDTTTALLMLRFYENLLGARKELKAALPRAEALEEARHWLRELRQPEAERLASALVAGKLTSTTRGEVVELNVRERPVKLPAGDRPYANPFFWAAFVLVGDPD